MIDELLVTVIEGAPNFAALIAFVSYLARRDERDDERERQREAWYMQMLQAVIDGRRVIEKRREETD